MRVATSATIVLLVVVLAVPGLPPAQRPAVAHAAPLASSAMVLHPMTGGPATHTPRQAPAASSAGWPTRTAIPFNNSSVPGNFLPTDGVFPTAAIYAAGLGEFFIVSTDTVSVVNASTREVVGGATLLYSVLNDGVYNPVNGRFYALDENCLVHELNPVGMVSVATIPVPCTPQSIAVNSTSGAVYVGVAAHGCSNAGQIAVINATSTSAWNVTVFGGVGHLAVDPLNGTLLFQAVNRTYNGVTCVSTEGFGWFHPGVGTANSSTDFITRQSLAWVTFSGNGTRVFATDQNDHIAAFRTAGFVEIGNVSFINSANDAAVVFNPVTGDLVASGLSSQRVEVIDPSNLTVLRNLSFPVASYYYYVGSQAILGVDSGSGDIFAPDGPLGAVMVANPNATARLGLTLVGASLDGVAVDPRTGEVVTQDDANGVVYLVNGTSLGVDNRTDYFGPYSVGGPVLFDPDTGAFASFYYSLASIYPSNGTILNTSGYSDCPGDAAFSKSNQNVWVTEPCVPAVYVFNSTSLSLVKKLRDVAGDTPNGIAYDPVHDRMYVAMGRSILVVNATTFVNYTSINMGWLVSGLAYSSLCRCVYAAFTNGGRIVGIATSNNTRVTNTSSDGAHWLTAVDPIGYVVGGEQYGANITVVNATTGRFVGQSPSGEQSQRVTYDPLTKELIVSSLGGGLTFINASTPFPVPPTYYAVTFHESGLGTGRTWGVVINGTNYSSTSNALSVDLINGTHAYQAWAPAGFAAVAPTGNVTVSGRSVSLTLRFDIPGFTSTVSFSEMGLPPQTPWTLAFNGTNLTSLATALFYNVTNGSYGYHANCSRGFVPTVPSGVVVVAGQSILQTVPFVAANFSVSFQERGLPNGTAWAVTVGASSAHATTSNLTVQLSNGTYAFAVQSPSAYTATPPNGSVAVNGTDLSVPIAFRLKPLYNVTFTEQGLPTNVPWSISLNGTTEPATGNTIVFARYNGSYGFAVGLSPGYASTPGSGSVTVDGSAVTIPLTWTRTVYSVTFSQSTLPSGTMWSVTLNGSTETSAGGSVAFSEPNGTYDYTVGTVAGYAASPVSGEVPISGDTFETVIGFSPSHANAPPPPRFNVTFAESGLPSGTEWSVTFNGTSRAGSANLTFSGFPNGTYAYSVGPVTGFGTPSPGTATVDGHSAVVQVVFQASSPNGTNNSTGGGGATVLGLPPSEGYGLIGGLVVFLVVAVGVAVVLRRRSRHPQDPTVIASPSGSR